MLGTSFSDGTQWATCRVSRSLKITRDQKRAAELWGGGGVVCDPKGLTAERLRHVMVFVRDTLAGPVGGQTMKLLKWIDYTEKNNLASPQTSI